MPRRELTYKGDTKMLIIKLDTAGQLFDALNQANRGFSYEACRALLEFYDELGENVEFDPVAISCDWNEVTAEQAERETGISLEELQDETLAYELDNGNILYHSF
jgi:hypothetical protein